MSGDFSSQVFLPSVLRVGGGSVVSLYPGLERTARCSDGRLAIHSGLGSIFAPGPLDCRTARLAYSQAMRRCGLRPFQGRRPLKGGAAYDEQVASFEYGLFDQVHVVCTCEEVFGCFYIAFVAGWNQDHAAVVRVDIAECPDDAHAVADAVVVLKVVGPGRVSGFVVAL